MRQFYGRISVRLVLALAASSCSAGDKTYLGRAPNSSVPQRTVSGTSAATGGTDSPSPILPTSATSNALTVHVEDVQNLSIEIVTLKCAGDCADVIAVARGGHPPYTWRWEDGSTRAERHVCPSASTQLVVTATDTAFQNAEFPYSAQTAQAQVKAEVLTCDAPGMPGKPCEKRAAMLSSGASSFDPVVKWSWTGGSTMATPVVANLTDDNQDGVIDLNDTPDIVINDYDSQSLVVLDGRTGKEQLRIAGVSPATTPALGDIDADHRIDIVAEVDLGGAIAAFHPDGKQIWKTALPDAVGVSLVIAGIEAVAIADLNHDGSPEILVRGQVLDARGKLLWSGEFSGSPVAADLDGDGYLEVIASANAYRYDGTPYYQNSEVAQAIGDYGAWTAVADVEGDETPEIVISADKLFVLDNRGKTLHSLAAGRGFPPSIHDLDGDGVPEILVSNGAKFTAYTGALTTRWSMPVSDRSGAAACTAFDFLGDGSAEAMYGDEGNSWGFDGSDGHVVFMQARRSGTQIEYPTVADVDNDGSADILITSGVLNIGLIGGGSPAAGSGAPPGLQVISDRASRWIPARRIMNQEAYHVTNVNEDGSIPVHELPHWKLNNSFRAQAQIQPNGTVCLPKR